MIQKESDGVDGTIKIQIEFQKLKQYLKLEKKYYKYQDEFFKIYKQKLNE